MSGLFSKQITQLSLESPLDTDTALSCSVFTLTTSSSMDAVIGFTSDELLEPLS